MAVDFAIKRSPAYRVARVRWKGPWSDAKVRQKFGQVVAWARRQKIRTGKWIFREPGEGVYEVAIEVRGRARSDGSVRVRTYAAGSVASVVFDPDVVSPRVVYHGLNDWLRWQKKDHTIRSAGMYREVYSDDPWKNAKAYHHTEVQVAVRR